MAVARKVNPCTACGQPGHRSDSKKCPKFGQVPPDCTYCKRTDGTHSAGCKRKAAKAPKRPKAALVVTGSRHPTTTGVSVTTAGNGLAAQVAKLQEEVARGKAAERELAAVREALA